MQPANSTGGSTLLPVPALHGPVTMSSREIAELVQSRHDKVKQSIERLAERGIIVQPPMGDEHFTDSMGRPRSETVYRIGKRDSYIIVAQLSPEFTAKLVDFWQAHEGLVTTFAGPATSDLASVFDACKRIAATAGLVGNQSILSAAQAARKITGTDPLLLIDAVHLVAPQNEALLTPSDIGKELGGMSGQKVNTVLTDNGFQTQHRDRKDKVFYQPTPKGEEAGATMVDTGKKQGGRPIRQLLWASRIVDTLRTLLSRLGPPG